LDVAKYSFGNRVVIEWNMLLKNIAMSKSVNEFKIDRYLASIRRFKYVRKNFFLDTPLVEFSSAVFR